MMRMRWLTKKMITFAMVFPRSENKVIEGDIFTILQYQSVSTTFSIVVAVVTV